MLYYQRPETLYRKSFAISSNPHPFFLTTSPPMQVPKVDLEEEYVNKVYNAIAPHFSSTRYKAWPAVDSFLRSQDPGSFGADIGWVALLCLTQL